jgi:hypothetical protein
MQSRCSRCRGNLYKEDPTNPKSDVWCLMCGAWIPPPGFTPLPYVVMSEDNYSYSEWKIDKHGDIVDIIDEKIEALIQPESILTVTQVAKTVHCSNSEARITLERLVRNGTLIRFTYGPQERWTAYIQTEKPECLPELRGKASSKMLSKGLREYE